MNRPARTGLGRFSESGTCRCEPPPARCSGPGPDRPVLQLCQSHVADLLRRPQSDRRPARRARGHSRGRGTARRHRPSDTTRSVRRAPVRCSGAPEGGVPPAGRGIQDPRVLANGNFAMSVNVETGRTYQVYSSSNLVDWTELTNFASATVTNQVLDATVESS